MSQKRRSTDRPMSGQEVNTKTESELQKAADFKVAFSHRLHFTRDAFEPSHPLLRQLIEDADSPQPRRVIMAVDAGLVRVRPEIIDEIHEYAAAHRDAIRLATDVLVLPGGEDAKNTPDVFNNVTKAIHDGKICRRSYVVAIGGGAILDAVGFSAACAHRGVRLIRLPSTTLAQGDAGVGVKNGINAFGKKNFLGSFSPAWAIVNDERMLETLSMRDFRSGFSEAVKVALLKDPQLFETLERDADALFSGDLERATPVIKRTAELHVDHIVAGGDPFELTRARPLDFGHWAAHKLEQMTDFSLSHGEAVSIGLALDTLYATRIGLLDSSIALRTIDILTRLGLPVSHEKLRDVPKLLDGLEEFREHLGGQLAITMAIDIGKYIDVHEIDSRLIEQVTHELLEVLPRRTNRYNSE
ncbi:MAG: 3-dehydroquinate synthase [Phycisphaerales bacterium]|nr:3-dehydroquinate synthase [Phycisphaerales bacterium]